jgi:ATP phosphoribosyltransferase
MPESENSILHLALPKGRMYDGVVRLLGDAGIRIQTSAVGQRGYRPLISLPAVEPKILKPQNIIEMLHIGTRDAGFAGADWVAELNADLVEVLDTGLDQVRLVAAAPASVLQDGALPGRPLTIASEYEGLTQAWASRRRSSQGGPSGDDRVIRSYGTTEVFPPEDADVIVDITATGATLEANGLVIVEDLMRSSTRLYASRAAMKDAEKRRRVEELALLLRSVLEARSRVMLELNVSRSRLAAVLEVLPCMRRPTLSALSTNGDAGDEDAGFAVKAAVPRERIPVLIPLLKSRGGTDIVISPIAQVVP